MSLVYRVQATATFKKALRKHAHHRALLNALDQKITRLRRNPHDVGGRLAGALHGYRSTRLLKRYRLIFSVDGKRVTLEALDHRKDAYG